MSLFSNLFKKDEKIITVDSNSKVDSCQEQNGSDIPVFQGDYAKTIFLWAHNKVSPLKKKEEYARYFLYECGIRDATAYHKGLITQGYFQEASNAEKLQSLTLIDLKKILANLGKPQSGKKDILIERIIENIQQNDLEKYFPEKLYILAENGKKFLEEHNDYVLIHTHKTWDIDWREYDLKHKDGFSFYDTVWGIFNERLLQDNHHFGRNIYLMMYQLLEEEQRQIRALEMLLKVFYLDFSGVEGLNYFKLYKEGIYSKKQLYDSFDVSIMIAPGLVSSIKNYKNVYEDKLVEKLYEWELPIRICDKKLFIGIIHSIFDGTYDEEFALENLRKAYKKFVEKL